MHGNEIEVAVALTNNPKAGGIKIAEAHNIPLEVIDSTAFGSREAFDHTVVERLDSYRPELTVLAGFMRILTPVFTDHIQAINLHPSLLPRHKGLKAIERSYADDYPSGGVSVHWVSSELDGGEVIMQKALNKEGLSFFDYEREIKRIEKIVLAEGIKKVLNGDVI
jgi:phosphoribosylglycinamide formyltransferase-1